MSTSDLVERVRAAIESHIEIAQKATPGPWRVGSHLIRSEPLQVLADAAHVALQNPQDTLRRCEADLRTLDQYDFAANELREMQAEQEKANVVAAMATVILKAVHDALYAVLVDRASAYGIPVEPEGS